MPEERRERRPAPLDAAAAWRAVAQDAPGASGLVGGAGEGQLSQRPVLSPAGARAKKAIVAVAASMLTAIHVMLARGVAYRDLGADHFERTNKERLAARLLRTLKQLGYTVALTPMNPTAPVPC